MHKIFDKLDALKRNDYGELVINNFVKPNTHFNCLFLSMVGHVHDLKQFGIDIFLTGYHKSELKSMRLAVNH